MRTSSLMRRFDRFLDALSRAEVSGHACNQYRRGRKENAIRRHNLRLYLEQLEAVGPRALLAGEAPSYRGGRLTGIPFTSESIMMHGAGPLLGAEHGYRKATPGERLSTEASATIVWALIQKIEPLPLLWNAFPFHPFTAGNPFSNRTPTATELLLGAPFLEWIIRLFAIEHVIAVGRLAERTLTRLGIAHDAVRHPAQGGKRKFLAGIGLLLG